MFKKFDDDFYVLSSHDLKGDGLVPEGRSPVNRATGSVALIDGSGVEWFANTNITYATTSSASAAMSDASFTHSVNATTSAGGMIATTLNDAFDGYNTLVVNGVVPFTSNPDTSDPNDHFYNHNGTATTEDGEREIVFATETLLTNIDVSRKVFVPTNDSFARWLNIFHNTGATTQTFYIAIANNLGSDANTRIVSSSDGDASPELSDNWITTFQNYSGTTSSDPRLGHILQGQGASTPLSLIYFNNGDDNPYWGYTLTLAPGQTAIIMNFAVATGSKAEAAAKAAELANLPANALQGMSDTEINQVVNFDPPPTAGIVVTDTTLTAGETSLVTFTFSEAVTGFDNNDLTVANGTLTPVITSDGGITWTATLTPSLYTIDSTNTITLNNTGVNDLAGHAGIGTTNSNNYAINNDALLSAITGISATADYQEGKLPDQPALLFPGLGFQDTDGGLIMQATVTIQDFQSGDWLLIDTSGTSMLAQYNRFTGVLSLSGLASEAAYTKVLQTVKFFSTQDVTVSETRDINVSVTDNHNNVFNVHTELTLIPSIIIGTELANTLNGTYAPDLIQGLEENDQLNGLGANDRLEGGDGNDVLNGGDANDRLLGGNGDDLLNGDSGNDTLLGGKGNDSLNGSFGNDRIFGSAGNDALIGGGGTDILIGGRGNDTLKGSIGNDTLIGGAGQDTLTGGADVDRFVFNSVPSDGNLDTLTDFASGQDIIALSAGIFTAYAGQVGNTVGLSDNLTYDAGTGVLAYDADGLGAGAAVEIALLGTVNHPAALGNDFLIIA